MYQQNFPLPNPPPPLFFELTLTSVPLPPPKRGDLLGILARTPLSRFMLARIPKLAIQNPCPYIPTHVVDNGQSADVSVVVSMTTASEPQTPPKVTPSYDQNVAIFNLDQEINEPIAPVDQLDVRTPNVDFVHEALTDAPKTPAEVINTTPQNAQNTANTQSRRPDEILTPIELDPLPVTPSLPVKDRTDTPDFPVKKTECK